MTLGALARKHVFKIDAKGRRGRRNEAITPVVVAQVGRRAEAQPSEHAGLEVNEDAKEAQSDHTCCLFPSSRIFVKLS